MTGPERTEFGRLEDRLFGVPGLTTGALGELTARLDRVESKLDRWDGAITLLRVGGGFLGLGGLAIFLRALTA